MKAVVFIDVQNDFINGALGCDMAKETINDVIEYANACAEDSNCIMLATQDTHEENYLTETLEGKRLPIEHCIKTSYGWELRDGLYDAFKRKYGNRMHDFIIEKPTFGSSELVQKILCLSESAIDLGQDIDTIEICGYCSSICVISNALLIRETFPNTNISILQNLCGDISQECHDAAMTVARNCQIDVVTLSKAI